MATAFPPCKDGIETDDIRQLSDDVQRFCESLGIDADKRITKFTIERTTRLGSATRTVVISAELDQGEAGQSRPIVVEKGK